MIIFLESRCHTNIRMGVRAHPSFGMTPTKAIIGLFCMTLPLFLCLPAELVAVFEKLNTPPGCCEVALLGAGVD